MFKKIAIWGVLLSFVLFGFLLKNEKSGLQNQVSKRTYIGWGKYTESKSRIKPLEYFRLK